MKAKNELAQLSWLGPSVVTVGVFDGVHRGHQYLLDVLQSKAEAENYRSVVVTFLNHPGTILRPETSIQYLLPVDQRIRLLNGTGVNRVVSITFDKELSLLRPVQFIRLLSRTMDIKKFVLGPDFAMGYRREGTISVLQELGAGMNFTVEPVIPIELNGLWVSSTAIRNSLIDGKVNLASEMLGYLFSLRGRVIRGEERGKGLGLPTANLSVNPQIIVPADGIYATWTWVRGNRLASATSIGTKPTFGSHARTIETHILDFSENLYDSEIQVEFVRRLRDQWCFDKVDDLVNQMHKDVLEARIVLRGTKS
ncbi:bifunctional riboflavin kinase/FAD synthetase [SAR202 cluster bacterium AD-802-E10_MRT_200m]|nr:bifunctional riboflavin kinase/FAD synthetase [SAR202 cluster bacterium AD-802-E10_MRT_200m]MQF82593.1 bifunctional riboflavin kinase/FAD synthetase [SAR202 cluster bacterium AD-802-E10_MRT_200m]